MLTEKAFFSQLFDDFQLYFVLLMSLMRVKIIHLIKLAIKNERNDVL